MAAQQKPARAPASTACQRTRKRQVSTPRLSVRPVKATALPVAFVGVGPAAVHSQLQAGENYFTDRQLDQARIAALAEALVDGSAPQTPRP